MTTKQIQYKDGYKHQLAEDAVFDLPAEFENSAKAIKTDYYEYTFPTITIRRGYAWDGASGPTWDTAAAKRASLIHDVIYQMIAENGLSLESRKAADNYFLALLKEDGMGKIRRVLWWWAVHKFGKGPAKKINPVITAP